MIFTKLFGIIKMKYQLHGSITVEKAVIKVDPFVSINGIKFGTAKEKVHEILGKPEDSFFKGDDDIETDVYSCFHTCYGSEYKF